jgi:hypothetical protein
MDAKPVRTDLAGNEFEAHFADDLLDCPCINISLEERAGLVADPVDGDLMEDDGPDAEMTKGFAPASQYDADVSPPGYIVPGGR